MTLAAVCGDGKFRWCLIIYHHLPIIWMVFHVPTCLSRHHFFPFRSNLAVQFFSCPSHFAVDPLYPQWKATVSSTPMFQSMKPHLKHLKSHQTTIKSHRFIDKSHLSRGSSPFFWAGLRLSPHGPRGHGNAWWGRQLFPAQQVLGLDVLDHPRPGWWMGWWKITMGKWMWKIHGDFIGKTIIFFRKNHWMTGDLVFRITEQAPISGEWP